MKRREEFFVSSRESVKMKMMMHNINSSTLKVFKAEAPCLNFGNFFSYIFLFIFLFYEFFGICLFPIRVPASFILIYYSRGTTKHKKYL